MTQELLLQPLLEQPQNAVPQSTILLFFSKTYCILLIILQLIFSFVFFFSDFLRSILTERSFSCLQRTKWEETLTFDLSHFLNNKKGCRTYMLLVKSGLSSSTSDPCSTEGEIALGELKKSSKDKSLAKPSRGSDLGLFEMTCSLKLSCGV